MDPDLFRFPERIAPLNAASAVCAQLVTQLEALGFPGYAIGAMPHPSVPYPGGFLVDNWPQEWHDLYFERNFGENDPTYRGMAGNGDPFSVDDLRQERLGFSLTPEEKVVLTCAAEIGGAHGLIVPIHRAHGYRGMACAFGPGPDPVPHTRVQLRFLLEHAHDRLRQLASATRPDTPLTPREMQVLGLARQGLHDAGIAEAAQISVRTVRFHFENARRKLAARSRAEAIAIAVGRHLLPA